jgi:hypothetical protein
MTSPLHDLDGVALRRDLPDHGLRTDDVGTIVHVHSAGEAFEVEFVAQSGRTIALLTLGRADVRPMAAAEETVARAVPQKAAA